MYCDTRPQDRSAGSPRHHRPRDDRRPGARPRQHRAGARHAARRRVRQPLQLLRSQLQGHSADRRGRPRDHRTAARPQDQDARRATGAGSTFTSIETDAAPRSLESLPTDERRRISAASCPESPRKKDCKFWKRPPCRRRSGSDRRLRRRIAADSPRRFGESS